MILNIAQILNRDSAILTRDALVCKKECLKHKKEQEIVLDLEGLEHAVSAWFDVLIYELAMEKMLEKVKFINLKEEIWQYKIDQATRFATDKNYRKFYKKIVNEMFL